MTTVQVFSGNEKCTQLIFRSSQRDEYLIVESSMSIVESTFPGLSTLLFNEIITLTSKSLLGVLVCNEESTDHLCSIIPLSELGPMCERALSFNDIKAFLQICQCSLPNIAIFECDEVKNVKKRIEGTSVRLPASFLWSLLILSEYFKVTFVMQQCKKQLLQKVLLVLPSAASEVPSSSSSAATADAAPSDGLFSVLADLSLVPALTQALNIHLLKFGPRMTDISPPTSSSASQQRPPPEPSPQSTTAASAAPSVVTRSHPETPPHTATAAGGSAAAAATPSHSSSGLSLFDDDATPTRRHHLPHSEQHQHPPSNHTTAAPSTPPRSSHHHHQQQEPNFSPSPIPHKLLLRSSGSDVRVPAPHPSQQQEQHYVTPSSGRPLAEHFYHTSPIGDDEPTPITAPGAAAPNALAFGSRVVNHQPRRSTSPLSRSVSPTAMSTRRQTLAGITAATANAGSGGGGSRSRSSSPSSLSNSRGHLNQPPMVHNLPVPMTATASSGGATLSYSYQDHADPSPAVAAYTEEQLRLSREVARLRLSEVRVRDEWLRLQQLGEKTLRENRLKTLQLTAEVARYNSVNGSSGGSPEGAAAAAAVGAGGYMVSTNPHSLNRQALKAEATGATRRSSTSGGGDVSRQHQTTYHSTPPHSAAAAHTSYSDKDIHEIYKSVAANRSSSSGGGGVSHSASKGARPLTSSGGGGTSSVSQRPSSAPSARPTTTAAAAAVSAETKTRAQMTVEEARHRAAARIRQKRREDKLREGQQSSALTETQIKLFQQRDEKIARFKERQLLASSEAYISSDPTVQAALTPGRLTPSRSSRSKSSSGGNFKQSKYSPQSLDRFDLQPVTDDEEGEEQEEGDYLDYEESARPLGEDHSQRWWRRSRGRMSGQRGAAGPVYTSEALRAVGQGLSPTTAAAAVTAAASAAVTPQRTPRPGAKHRYSQVQDPGSSPPESFHYLNSNNTTAASFTTDNSSSGGSVLSSPDVITAARATAAPGVTQQQQQRVLTVIVHRATDLTECLGSTSAYVTFDWGRQYGRNSTQCVRDSCHPVFNSILKFRLPSLDFSRLSSTEVEVPPVKVLVFNRRESVSDELIAQAELDIVGIIKTNLLTNNDQYRSDVHTLYLTNSFKEFAGYIDVSVDY